MSAGDEVLKQPLTPGGQDLNAIIRIVLQFTVFARVATRRWTKLLSGRCLTGHFSAFCNSDKDLRILSLVFVELQARATSYGGECAQPQSVVAFGRAKSTAVTSRVPAMVPHLM